MGREQNSASRRGVKGCENFLSSAHCRAVVFWNRWAVLSQIGCAERRFHVFERVSGDVAFFPIVPKGSFLCASREDLFYRFDSSFRREVAFARAMRFGFIVSRDRPSRHRGERPRRAYSAERESRKIFPVLPANT